MLRFTDITGKRIDKVETAIARIKSFQPEEGYYLAFSGGKDSNCIKRLADMAGAKYEAHYNVTTVDPPELTRFIKYNHPDVIWNKPEYSMQKLIARKGIPPTRYARYCCEVLKEGGGKGRIVLTGVRWSESPRRRDSHGTVSINKKDKETGKRIVLNDDNDESRRMVEQCYRTTKTLVNPIIDWEDEDVWEFIKEENLPYCSLYDEGFKRLGCVGCPLAGGKAMEREFERWPQYKKLYLKAFDMMLQERRRRGMGTMKWETPEDVFDYWIGNYKKQQAEGQLHMKEIAAGMEELQE